MRISDWSSDVCSSDLAGAQHPPGDHVRHAHRAEIEVDLVAELFPEVMGLAATLVAAAAERLAGRAAGGTDRLVDRQDDVGDARLAGSMSEQVAAARPPTGKIGRRLCRGRGGT